MALEIIAQSAASHSNHFNQIEFLPQYGVISRECRSQGSATFNSFRKASSALVRFCLSVSFRPLNAAILRLPVESNTAVTIL